MFNKLIVAVERVQIPSSEKGVIKPGEFILELFSKANITTDNIEYIQEALEVVNTIISGMFRF